MGYNFLFVQCIIFCCKLIGWELGEKGEGTKESKKRLMDTDSSMVIARGKKGTEQ